MNRRRASERGSVAIIAAAIFSTLMAGTSATLMLLNERDARQAYLDQSRKIAHTQNLSSIELVSNLVQDYKIQQQPWDDGTVTWVASGTGKGAMKDWQFNKQNAHHPDQVSLAECNYRNLAVTNPQLLGDLFSKGSVNPSSCLTNGNSLSPSVRFSNTTNSFPNGPFALQVDASSTMVATASKAVMGFKLQGKVDLPVPMPACRTFAADRMAAKGGENVTLRWDATLSSTTGHLFISTRYFTGAGWTGWSGWSPVATVARTPKQIVQHLPEFPSYPAQVRYRLLFDGLPIANPPHAAAACPLVDSITLTTPCPFLDPSLNVLRDLHPFGVLPANIGAHGQWAAGPLDETNCDKMVQGGHIFWGFNVPRDPGSMCWTIGRMNCTMHVDCAVYFAYLERPNLANCDLSPPISLRINSCFDPDTRIQLADGSWKRAKEIVVNDRLINPVTGRDVVVKNLVIGGEKWPLWRVRIGDKTFRATDTHPVLTPEGPKQLREVRAGDEILTDTGEFEVVDEAAPTPVRENQFVINFNLDTYHAKGHQDHWVNAEGIVAGDNALQLRMMAKRGQMKRKK